MLLITGGVVIIVAYRFAAPTAAAIMSVLIIFNFFHSQAECNEAVQGKGIALLSYGGQSAQILSPLVLNNIMTWKMDSPYYVSLIPSKYYSMSQLFIRLFIICNDDGL